MNPEEGRLRPQIMDRFGLRVIVRGLSGSEERLQAYRRVQAYMTNPRETSSQFAKETKIVQEEIQLARDLLHQVELPDEVARLGLTLVEKLEIDSLRAEITLFEAARAHAIADGRLQVAPEDLHAVAPMTLRLRRSTFIADYFGEQEVEESELVSILNQIFEENDEE
jgi:magnesium chelatase subunit I